ncbi:MAG: MFS transporter [Ignavibacteriaceae bacterium]|nr:MFS transporter [Ignavibacteriaceae bacterium]
MTNRKRIFVWTLFDFANTSFAIVVTTFLYAIYFTETVAKGDKNADLYWSISTSAAMFITAFLAPVMGAIADYSKGKKKFLLFFTLLCIINTGLLYFVGEGNIAAGMILFILANIGFEAGLIFYDAFLPEITSPKNYGRVSGYGYAMGYLGSLSTLAVVFPFINNNLIKETFPLSALFFLIFALPIFLFLKEKRADLEDRRKSYISIGMERVGYTLSHLKNYKNLSFFLLSYFLFIEGVNTVIYFAGIFAKKTLGFSMTELIIFFLTVQSTAIIGSILFGILSDSIGQKKSLVFTLLIWIFTIGFAYFVNTKELFYVVGLLAGVSMGSSQSISRSLMTKLTPEEKKTEFFGFYSFFGKSSAIIGPLLFGVISSTTGNQRYAILSVLFFFISGLLVLLKVNDSPEKTEAVTENAGS